MNRNVLEFLGNIGVDIRFISVWKNFLFINNLKFSRFSRRKEELFQSKFLQWKVIRSKIFQKMCIRASRVLSKSLNPQETIFIKKTGNCDDLTLNVILEPYKRKYGIKIISGDDFKFAYELGANSIASPLSLDMEVDNIINQMFQGKKIRPISRDTKCKDMNIIYPLINIPQSWINSWIRKNNLSCQIQEIDGISADLIDFFEEFIPQVRENILKSALFVSRDK